MKVTGQGFSGEAYGTDVRVSIAEIRLASTGKLPAVRYSALGIAVYQQGKILGAAWNHGVGGELTPAAPSATLVWQAFVVPWAGPQCLKGGCEARLQLRVVTDRDAHAEHADFAALPVTAASAVAQRVAKRPKSKLPAPSGLSGEVLNSVVDNLFADALTAVSENRRSDAETALRRVLIHRRYFQQDVDHPVAAVMLSQMSYKYKHQKNAQWQELALRWALEILERDTDREVKRLLGGGDHQWSDFDKETVARRLADLYREQGRYDQAYAYYERAHRYVREVQMSGTERNNRLARNAAGRMASACAMGNWAVADLAMKELKERIVKVDAEAHKELEYWVRTGEPRLAARKC